MLSYLKGFLQVANTAKPRNATLRTACSGTQPFRDAALPAASGTGCKGCRAVSIPVVPRFRTAQRGPGYQFLCRLPVGLIVSL